MISVGLVFLCPIKIYIENSACTIRMPLIVADGSKFGNNKTYKNYQTIKKLNGATWSDLFITFFHFRLKDLSH